MSNTNSNNHIRTVAKNGQIALGKNFAGKQVRMDILEDGSLMIRPIVVIPENELWLYQGDNIARIQKSLEWAKSNPPQDNFEEMLAKIENEYNKNRYK